MPHDDKMKDFFSQRHPDYIKWMPVWEKMYCAYLGGTEFKKTFLWRFECEDNPDYENRLGRSAYENLLLDIVKRREGLVYGRKIVRKSETNKQFILDAINKNTDKMGTPRDPFIQKCFRLMQVFGWLPVLTDKSSGILETQQDQRDQQLFPYAVPILPLNFLNWSVDKENQLIWALIKTVRDISVDRYTKTLAVEYRIVTRDTIEIWREPPSNSGVRMDPVLIRIIEHGLGIVPIVLLNDLEPEQTSIVGRPSLLDPCDLSVKLFNQSSWYDQLIYKTNYATLAIHPFDDEGVEKEKVVGPGLVIWVKDGESMPEWIAPNTDAADVFERKLADMRRRIYEQAELEGGFAEEGTRDISGKAHTFRSRPTEDMARRLAQGMEDFECDLETMLMVDWEEDTGYKCKVYYPRTFGIMSTSAAIEELEVIDKSQSLPPSVKGFLAARIITTSSFVELSDEEIAVMEKETMEFNSAESQTAREEAGEEIRTRAQRETETVRAQTDIEVAAEQTRAAFAPSRASTLF